MKPSPEFKPDSIPANALDGTSLHGQPVARMVPVVVITLAVVTLLAVYLDVARAMVTIWNRSETFAHGFLVAPASVWLAWGMRNALKRTAATPFWPGLILVVLSGAGWLVAESAGVASVAQLALVMVLVSAIVTIGGWRVALVAAFPLAFLFFAVPIGEFMVPWLMDRTADFTVAALRATGIPVFREGNFFVIPSGSWSVVEACSGIRYLIASLVGGALFAHLFYRTWWRKAAVLAASIIVPLIANWLRAYMIVMIGHLSGNTLAVDIDHLIYGWVFFGLVMFLFFWVASFWREDGQAAPTPPPSRLQGTPASTRALLAALVAVVAAAGVWRPVYAWLDARGAQSPLVLKAPNGQLGWQAASASTSAIAQMPWTPTFEGPRAVVDQTFTKNDAVLKDATVRLYIAAYRGQNQESELVNSGNVLLSTTDKVWRAMTESTTAIDWDDGKHSARGVELRGEAESILVHSWYWIEGRAVTSDIEAKLLLAWQKLGARGDDSAAVVLSARYPTNDPAARARAQQAIAAFGRDMGAVIDRELAAMPSR